MELKKLVFRDKENYRNKNNKVIKKLFLIKYSQRICVIVGEKRL